MTVLITILVISGAILLAGLAPLVGWLSDVGVRRTRRRRTLRAELYRHQMFIQNLRELAWSHRELDPNLSTVVVDEIRNFTANTPPREIL